MLWIGHVLGERELEVGSKRRISLRKEKACELIDVSSMLSTCLFVPLSPPPFECVSCGILMPCVQSSCFRFPQLGNVSILYSSPSSQLLAMHSSLFLRRTFLVLLRRHGFGSGLFTSMLAFNLPPSE